MAGSAQVEELEQLLAQLCVRWQDERFVKSFKRRHESHEVRVQYDSIKIDARGVHHVFGKRGQNGHLLTEGVYVIPSLRRVILAVRGEQAYVMMGVFDLAALITTAPKSLSAADTDSRFNQMITSARALLAD